MPKRKFETRHKCILHTLSICDHGQFTSLNNARNDASTKLKLLHEIRDKRLNEPNGSAYRMQAECNQIPSSLPDNLEHVGYHRQCYQRFTGNLNLLKPVECTVAESQWNHSPRKVSLPGPLFPPECIFCDQIEIKVKRKTVRPEFFSSFKNKENAWEHIELRAEKLGLTRLHRQVKNQDLFACGAKHHPSCLKTFRTMFANHERRINRVEQQESTEHSNIASIHKKAFTTVLEYIQENVVEDNAIVMLSTLRMIYVEVLARNGHPQNYRSEKLLKHLESSAICAVHVQFIKVDSDKSAAISFWIACSKTITLSRALGRAYHLGSADMLKNVAIFLRRDIQQAFKETNDMAWPPTANDLELTCENILPADLIRLLGVLITGREDEEINGKNRRLIFSIGQDLCRAVSEGKWKLPKHILLCVTVRHLFRSKQLTTILHRLGHSEGYDFGLELETAIAKSLDNVSSYLTPQIVTGEGNIVFHCEWDNLNKMTTNIHGSNIVNSAGGIMIQEIQEDLENLKIRKLPILNRTQQRSLKVDTPETIPPLHFNRVGPTFPENALFTPPAENETIYRNNLNVYYIWLFSRFIGSSGRQPVPSLGGFTSATGMSPVRKSTVDYFTPIHQPITDNAVVYELLKRSESATSEVGQKWVLNTFDLGVCSKALPIIWKWPDEFANHVVMIGPFHTSMNYIGMIAGHKMKGTGLVEILLESQLVTSGSLKGVLSGKAYAKSLFCIKSVCEAIERLLIEQFIEEENLQVSNPSTILNITQTCTRENLTMALEDPNTLNFIQKYYDYEEKVRNGHLGKTAAFWMSFITHCHLLFMLLHSVKTNNLQLFHKCNGDMAALFFAYDGCNYSR